MNRGCGFYLMVCLLVVALFAGIGWLISPKSQTKVQYPRSSYSTCSSRSTSSSGSKSTRSTKSTSSTSSSSKPKTVSLLSELEVGKYMDSSALNGGNWTYEGTDSSTCSVRTKKYSVRNYGTEYVVWVDSSNCIKKVTRTYVGGKSSSGSKATNPMDPKKYAHPEDFYEEFWDDFSDYEEAEDYCNKHR